MERLSGIKNSIYFISFPLAFIGFILPVYAVELGASILEIGIMYSLFSLFGILLRPLVGKLIDSKGRKSGVIIGLVSYSIVVLLLIIGSSYNYLIIARIFQGMAGAFLWISVNAMISDVSDDKNRSKNFGEVEQVANRGAMLGSFIGFMLLFNISSNDPFRLIFLVYFAISVYGVYQGLAKGAETLPSENTATVNDNFKTATTPLTKKFMYFLAIMMILSLVATMIAPMYLIFMRDHVTNDLGLISFLYVPGAILSLFLPKKLGSYADIYGRKKLLAIGMVIQAAVVFSIPLLSGYYKFLVAYTILSIGNMLVGPARMSLVTELTGGVNRGRNYSYYSTAIGLGGVIGPLAGASIYQYVGYAALFYAQGVTVLISLLFISIILRDPIESNLSTKKESML